jgi:hypothetical protein
MNREFRPRRSFMDFLSKNYAHLNWIVFIAWLCWAFTFSLTSAINIPTTHMDGAFQTASSLYRLADGQVPGRDFFPYLGIGPLAFLYPLFFLLGSDVSASVTSAQFIVLLVGAFSTSVIWHLIWRPQNLVSSVVAGCMLFSIPLWLGLYFNAPLPPWVRFEAYPGNSLRPFRSAAPYFSAALYLFVVRNGEPIWKQNIYCGVLAGLILLWSNDFAIPSAGLLLAFHIVNLLRRRDFSISALSTVLATMFVTWTLMLTVATAGHPFDMLRYNFVDVAKDQWWYFPPYDESSRIMGISQIWKLISVESIYPLVVLAACGLKTYGTKSKAWGWLFWIGLTLFAGGTVASVGGHLGGYFGAFSYWSATLTSVYFLHELCQLVPRLAASPIRNALTAPSRTTLLIPLLALTALATAISVMSYWKQRNAASQDSTRFFAQELGGYLTLKWKPYIQFARSMKDKRATEEYWGLWSATLKIFPNLPVDSVIHALGSTRQRAYAQMSGTEVIITTNKFAYPEWQPWSFSQNFWFYEQLENGWHPVFFSPGTIVWTRTPGPPPATSAQLKPSYCSVMTNTSSYYLMAKAPEEGLYALEVRYTLKRSGRQILLVKNNLSFVLDAAGYASVDPGADSTTIPVLLTSAGENQLPIKLFGSPPEMLSIRSCSLKKSLPDYQNSSNKALLN